jgi:hypothetical protein
VYTQLVAIDIIRYNLLLAILYKRSYGLLIREAVFLFTAWGSTRYRFCRDSHTQISSSAVFQLLNWGCDLHAHNSQTSAQSIARTHEKSLCSNTAA